jgi:uncharacterized cupredoxin-like copper-binding protein
MKRVQAFAATAMILATFGLAGCGADPTDMADGGDGGPDSGAVSNKITGSVQEWKVDVSARTANEGQVIFAIANFGTIAHEFLVVKTDYEDGKIPLGEDNRFNEEASGLEVVDEIPEWPVNTAGVLKVDLKAGNYQLLCNISGHYAAGMHVPFTVVKGEDSTTMAPETTNPSESYSEEPKNDISGSVKEWVVSVDAHESKAGDVNFTITNEGTITHEFLVVKTDYEPGKIPLGKENRFDEEAEGITVIDEIPEWNPGETKKLKVTLEPGKYQVLCNIAGHYANGMYAPLIVSN